MKWKGPRFPGSFSVMGEENSFCLFFQLRKNFVIKEGFEAK